MDKARDLEKARGSTDAVSGAARRRELHKHVAQEASASSQGGRGSSSASAAAAAAAPRPAQIKPTLAGLAASAKARGQNVGARMDFRHLTVDSSSSSTAGTAAAQAAAATAAEHAAPPTRPVPLLPPPHAAMVAKQSAAAIAKSLATSQNRAAFGRPLGGLGGRGLGGGAGPRSAKPAGKNDELRKLKQLGGKKSLHKHRAYFQTIAQ